MKKIQTKRTLIAYLLSINIYIFARHIIQIFTNHLFYGPSPGMGWVYFVNGLVFTTTFLCGCLMASFIERKAWLTVLHGALATATGATLYVSFYYLPLKDYIFSAISGAICGAILGGAGSIVVIAIKLMIKKYRCVIASATSAPVPSTTPEPGTAHSRCGLR